MSFLGYLAFARTSFQSQMAYRHQVWTSVFSYLVQIFARVAIWTALIGAGAGDTSITLRDMVTYSIVALTLVMAVDYAQLLSSIGNSVKTGDIAVYLLKPMRYPLYLLFVEVGHLAYRLIAVVVPVVGISWLIYGMAPPASIFHGAMFLPFYLIAFAILFLLSILCGLIAFWTMTVFSLEWLLQGMLAIFSGTFIPFWFFPERLAAVVQFAPFAWIGYYPGAVYLGKLDAPHVLAAFGGGCIWIVALAAIVALLWRRATLRMVVQGG